MWLLRSKYIVILLILSSCKSGIQVDKLGLNEKIIADIDLVNNDITGLMKDYASVNSGITLSDGFDLAQPTDAARMIDEVKANKHIFIEIPKDEYRKDHIGRTLAAAAMRLMLQPSHNLVLKTLDTKEILKDINDLNLNVSSTQEYFLRIAELLAKKEHHVFVIDLDDIEPHVPLKDFFAKLSSIYLVVFARKALDQFPDFWQQSGKTIFIPNGLNPGHLYSIAKKRLLRAKANPDDAVADDLALRLAKYLTALEPYTTISSVVKVFTLLNNSLEQSPLSSTIKEDITRTLADNYKASYEFLINLNLDAKTLTDMYNAIKNNYLAFDEQNYQTNEIIKNMGIYHRTKPPWVPPIEDEIKIIKDDGKITLANSHRIKHEVLDIRGYDLPNMESSIKDDARENKDEIVYENKKEMRAQSQNIIKTNKEEAITTRQDIKKATQNMLDDTRQDINDNIARNIEGMTHTYGDYLKDAVKKVVGETKANLKLTQNDINHHTSHLVKKAKDEVITTSQDLAQEVITKTADNLRDEHEVLGHKLAKNLADTKNELNQNIKSEHQHTQKIIKQHVSDEVSNQTDNVGKIIDEHKNETIEVISDKLTKAIAAILANQSQVIKGLDNNINQHTTATVKKAENNLSDALGQAKDDIIKDHNMASDSIIDEHKKALNATANATKDAITAAQTAINTNTDTRKNQLTTEASNNTNVIINKQKQMQDQYDDTVTAINKTIDDHINDLQSRIDERFKQSLASILDDHKKQTVDINTHTDTQRDNINANTNAQKALLSTDITNAQAAINAHTDAQRDNINTNTDARKDELTTEASNNTNVIISKQKQMQDQYDDTVTAINKTIDDHINDLQSRIDERFKQSLASILDDHKKQTVDINTHTDNQRDTINAHTNAQKALLSTDITNAQAAINAHTDTQRDNINANTDARKIELTTEADNHTTAITNAITAAQHHTKNIVHQEGELNREDIAQAKEALSNIMQDEVSQVIAKINKIPELSKVDQQRIARRLAQVIIGYVLGRKTQHGQNTQPGMAQFNQNLYYDAVTNTYTSITGGAAAGAGVAVPAVIQNTINTNINSIEEAPSLEDDRDLSTSYLREVIDDLINN